MLGDVKNFDYEGTWEEVKGWFQEEVQMLEDKLVEFEEKIAEWKEKANEVAHEKMEEVNALIQAQLSNVEEKLKGKWDEANDKYQIEDKVKTLKKHYDQLKKQMQK